MFNRSTFTSLLGGIALAMTLASAPSTASAASPSSALQTGLSSFRPSATRVITANPQPSTHPPAGHPAGTNSGPSIETMTLQPSNLMTSYHYTEADNDGPPYCGLHTNGTGPEPTAPGEILAGYYRYWDPGTQPFPCWETDDQVYRGAAKFDFTRYLHDLIEPRKFLISAKLRFDVTFEDASNGWPTGCPNPLDLLQASVDWTGGTPDLIPGDEMFNVPVTDQHTNEVDVSLSVRRWLAYGDSGDNGFVFRQGDEGYPRQNATCIAHIHNLAMDLQYVPVSN